VITVRHSFLARGDVQSQALQAVGVRLPAMPVAPTPMTAPLPMPVASPLLAQLGRLGELFDLLGAVAIVAGALLTAQRALRTLRRQGGEAAYSVARETFGRGLLLGLEILIAADLLRSVSLNLTLSSIATLGLLVVVRTVLSFSVQIELEGDLPWRLARQRGGNSQRD